MKRFLSLALAVATLSFAACHRDTTGLPGAASFQLTPVAEAAPAGSPIRVTITALDENGQPMPEVGVTFTPNRDGKVVPSAVGTNAAGQAQATWTLGDDAGQTYDLMVMVGGVTRSQRFHVKAQ